MLYSFFYITSCRTEALGGGLAALPSSGFRTVAGPDLIATVTSRIASKKKYFSFSEALDSYHAFLV